MNAFIEVRKDEALDPVASIDLYIEDDSPLAKVVENWDAFALQTLFDSTEEE